MLAGGLGLHASDVVARGSRFTQDTAGRAGIELADGIVVDEYLSSTGPTRSTREPPWRATCSARTSRYDRIPYFDSDQYDTVQALIRSGAAIDRRRLADRDTLVPTAAHRRSR
jgi:hypothetical protein